MSRINSIAASVGLILTVISGVEAATIAYSYSATVTHENRNGAVATAEQRLFSEGDIVSGTFVYDTDVSADTVTADAVFYPAFKDLTGSIAGNLFSDTQGEVKVQNDTFSLGFDLLRLIADSPSAPAQNFSGFQLVNNGTTFAMVDFQFGWLGFVTVDFGEFLSDFLLPGLPPVSVESSHTEVVLEFEDILDANNTHIVFADLQIMTAVPVPPAFWLLGSALGLLGWMRRKAA